MWCCLRAHFCQPEEEQAAWDLAVKLLVEREIAELENKLQQLEQQQPQQGSDAAAEVGRLEKTLTIRRLQLRVHKRCTNLS